LRSLSKLAQTNGKFKKRSKSLLTILTRFSNFSDQYVIFLLQVRRHLSRSFSWF